MMVYTRPAKSKPKKAPKAQREQYEKWLKSHQPSKSVKILQKSCAKIIEPPKVVHRTTEKLPSLNSWVTGPLSRTGIMRDYHKYSAEDRQKIDSISKSVAPLHKSNYVYVSEGMNPASLGRKNEVL
jgi:hypothetical protein